jgi:arabinofuranan 3-O-arabinosyltransferase
VTRAVDRLRTSVACMLLTALVFTQDAGRVVADTKLDLTVDPVGLLARALHLWDPQGGAGELQNQAYGYLFPLGPLAALMHAASVPDWVGQRVWQSLVLCTALLGVRALADRLGLGSPGTRLLAGVAYALAARPVSQLGAISVEVWPYALAPWVLVPLVTASRGGSPRRAAARSGLVVLLVGGVNAAATVAVLPLGALWLHLQPPGPARRCLVLWWGGAVACATAWWLGPLLVLGRYSPPFLDVIERASVTTRQNGLWSALTGNDLWLQYLLVNGEPARPGGFLLVTHASLVLCATAVCALGVLGVVRSSTPHRAFLSSGLLMGLLLVTAGHVGAFGSPFGPLERQLLDGPLAALRNVHKFDLVLRLPLVLGLAHAASSVRLPRASQLPMRRPVIGLALLAVLGAATPALGNLEPPGSWVAVPAYWHDVADYLHDASPGPAPPRALVVPAVSFGDYLWGRTADEPLQPLAETPWVVRDAVPLGGPGLTRVLDTVEEALRSGRGSPALATYLARAGIRFLVVRNDLDSIVTDAVRPVVLHAALTASSGIRKVAEFGPPVGAGFFTGPDVYDAQLSPTYSAVEVYEVQGSVESVSTWPRAGTQRVSGGPESLLPLLEQGVVAPTGATRLAGESALPGEASELRTLTDGYRARSVDVGRAADSASATLDAQAVGRDRDVRDYLPVPLRHADTTAVEHGVLAVSASSSASDASTFLVRGRDHVPAAAFDGDGATTWVSGGLEPQGQWVQARFERRVVTAVEVATPVVAGTVAPTRVRVTTDSGQHDVPMVAGEARVELGTPTTRLRVTVLSVSGAGRFGVVSVEVRALTPIGPILVERGLRLADDAAVSTGGRAADPRVAVVLSAGRRDRPGCLLIGDRPVCAAALPLGDEDDPAVDATFSLDRAEVFALRVSGRARPGEVLDSLLQQGLGVQVSASSTSVPDPAQRPAVLVDGDRTTSWLASTLDQRPTVVLDLATPRRITGVRVIVDEYLAASRPTAVAVRIDDGPVHTARLDVDGKIRFPAVVGSRVEVSFTKSQVRQSHRRDGLIEPLPVGVSELQLIGPSYRQVLDRDAPVVIPCGKGPLVAVDGQLRAATRVTTTVGALLDGGPIALDVCGGALEIPAGSHHVRVGRTDLVQVTGATLVDLARPQPSAGPNRVTGIDRWGATQRALEIGPGPESWLVVHEAFNRGWQAELDGRPLTAARLDGWQQGFVLPAGEGGRVRLEFAPDRTYAWLLGLGGLLALLVVLAAAVTGREPVRPVRGSRPGRTMLVAGALAVPVLGGAAGVVALLVAVVARRAGREVLPAVVVTSLLAAGALVALQPWPRSALVGHPVQALCLLAVAGLAVGSWPRRDEADGELPDRGP